MEAVDRTFVIGDIRGYTRFTREHGDEAAARLAVAFAELARDAVEARGGSVVELRGDEALCVFDDSADAVRAALELQLLCAEEYAAHPDLPLHVGIGVDAGEAVPVEDGYRGTALNLAARLCANAAAGQVLVSGVVAERVSGIDGLFVDERGDANLKGFEERMPLLEVSFTDPVAPLPHVSSSEPTGSVDPTLATDVPLAGRGHELRRLRGLWRVARRGQGEVVVLRGPSGIGKTRLAAELAALVADHGGRVDLVGLGGSAPAQLRRQLSDLDSGSTAAGDSGEGGTMRPSGSTQVPRLLVVDDVDAMGTAAVDEIAAALPRLRATPTLLLLTSSDEAHSPELEELLGACGPWSTTWTLGPLDTDGVREIAGDYVDLEHADVPVEAFTRDSGGVPARVHEVVDAWVRDEANRRLAAAAQWADQRSADLAFANDVIGRGLKRLYGPSGSDGPDDASVGSCPYLGLASFDGDDAGRFFGREILVGELAARSVGAGLLCVVGPSGAGKSSVVAAGLVPSLAAGLLPGSEHWDAVAMRPGEHPMAEWAALRPREPGCTRRVVVVDQLEELFTCTADEVERTAFVDELVELASDPEAHLVVLGIRGDHYASTAAYPELAELIAANTVIVGPMSRDELRRAIELPARRAGRHVEIALTDALVHDSLDRPGALPLLSTALVELWRDSDGGWLRLATYQEQGGLSGAVARLAERSYAALTPPQQEAARAILLRLVTTNDDEQVSRRPVPLADFDVDRDPVAAVVIARLTDDRLLTQDGTHVEVAHEALIREWPRLREWLGEDAEGRQLRAHLARSSAQWEARGESPDELLRGARLAAALDWSTSHGRDLNRRERAFVQASRAVSEQEAAAQRRSNRRLRGLLIGTAAFLVVAVIAGGLAVSNEARARQQTLAADAQRVGALSAVEQHADLALLLAAEGYHLEPSPETYSSLLEAMLRFPTMLSVSHPTGQRVLRLASPPSGTTYAIADASGSVVVTDAATGDTKYPPLHLPFTREMAYSGDGRTLYLLGWPNRRGGHLPVTLRAVDVATGQVRWRHAVPKDQEDSDVINGSPGTGILQSISGSNDVAWSRPRGGVAVYGPNSSAVVARYPASPDFIQLVLPHHRIVQLGDNRSESWRIRIIDADSQQVREAWSSRIPLDSRTTLSADGRYLAVAGQLGNSDGLIAVVDLRTHRRVLMHGQVSGWVAAMAFSPDDSSLVTVDDAGHVDEWGVTKGDHLDRLVGHGAFLRGVAFADHGREVVTTGMDGQLITWDASNARGFTVQRPRSGPPCEGTCVFAWMGMIPGSDRLAVIEPPQDNGWGIQLMDATTLEPLGAMPGPVRDCCGRPALSPDGRWLAAIDPLHARVTLFDVSTGDRIRTLLQTTKPSTSALGGPPIDTAAYAPDGRWVASNINQHVVVVDPTTGAVVATLPTPEYIEWVAFSPDSQHIVASSDDGSVTVWSTAGWTKVWQRRIDQQIATPAEFSPDGTTLVVGSQSGQIHVLDAANGEDRRAPIVAHASWVSSLSFSPDGTLLASTGIDGQTLLWDVQTGRQVGEPFVTPSHSSSGFGHDGVLYVNTYQDVYRIDVAPADLMARACRIAGRSLTDGEWQRYLPDRPHDDACAPTQQAG